VEYWSLEAELAKKLPTAKGTSFRAALVGLAGDGKLDIHDKKEAEALTERLRQAVYKVLKVTTRQAARQPAPPFITSTLQQEAWRKLHFPAKLTMETREYIAAKYGKEYLPEHARTFTTTVKGAQEAHEAIRPTKVSREPSLVKSYLSDAQFKLYQLIWKRMVASQMAPALFDNTTVDIQAKGPRTGPDYLLRTSTSVNTFPGFIVLYTESKDEAEEETQIPKLPPLEKGDGLSLLDLFPEQHFTQPPPRFTEATLVKILEQYGIGRPSTYAPIISTIQDRDYVTKMNGAFQPTDLGFVVNDLLSQHFKDIVDVDFTAHMEDELDKVAGEHKDWISVIKEFYTPFAKTLETATQTIEKVKLEEPTDEVCPKCGKPMLVKYGRFGKFLACSGYPECKSTKPFLNKIGVKCPDCSGDIVQRISKKKRTFYGCSRYPECKFVINFRPLAQPCPKCGALLTSYRKTLTRCTKCEYKGKAKDGS
jgi:DNA topoisomerase-1